MYGSLGLLGTLLGSAYGEVRFDPVLECRRFGRGVLSRRPHDVDPAARVFVPFRPPSRRGITNMRSPRE